MARVGQAGKSRIVSQLDAGSIVTSPRHQIDVIVTEHGAAQLAGRTVGERAHALVEIAHPDAREELRAAAHEIERRGVLVSGAIGDETSSG
jgi:acyl-CoA hydrolase